MPQGSILRPLLFNLNIINLVENITCDSLHYVDDSTLFKHSKPTNLKRCIEELLSDLETVSLWSLNNSLAFHDDKTKLMLFSTTQLSQRHNLNNSELFKVIHNVEAIERVHPKKILGIQIDKNLSWSCQVNKVIQSSYARLTSLRHFKRFTPYKVCKSLSETLIISKTRYRLVVYSQLSKYQIQQLQKTQNRVASYVLGRLSWLPITELMGFSTANSPYTTQTGQNTCL